MQELWQASWEVGLGAPARRRACLWLSERAEIETAAWPRQTLVGRALTLGQVAWPTSPVEIWLKVVLTLGLITSILVTMGNCLRAVFPAPLGTKKQNKTKQNRGKSQHQLVSTTLILAPPGSRGRRIPEFWSSLVYWDLVFRPPGATFTPGWNECSKSLLLQTLGLALGCRGKPSDV